MALHTLLKEEFFVGLDYLALKLRFGFLQKGVACQDKSRKVLFVNLSHHPAYAKLDGMLSTALQAQGCTPAVLTVRSSKRAQRFHRLFGIRSFLFLEDFLERTTAESDSQTLDSLFNNPSFSNLLACEKDGIDCGRHALSGMVRKLRNKGVSFDDPELITQLRNTFAHSLNAARAAELLFKEHNFEAVIFTHEKGYTPYGEVFDAATNAGLNVIQVAHSQRSDAYVLKRYSRERRTRHHSSLSPKSWEAVQAMRWDQQKEDGFMETLRDSYAKGTWFHRNVFLVDKKIKSSEQVKQELGIDVSKKTVTVFSHILWDATFFFGTSLFADYEQWLVATVQAACANDRVNWLIKLHPDYTWKMSDTPGADPRDVLALQANIGALPPHVHVVRPETDISTYSFFQITDYAITVRGTVGIEAPCFGIPVLTAGTGRYDALGITVDSATKDEYLDRLAHIEDIPTLTPEQTSLARRHAYALFTLRILPFSLFELVRSDSSKLGRGLDHNVTIRAKTWNDVADDIALRQFGDWVLHSKDEDFLSLS